MNRIHYSRSGNRLSSRRDRLMWEGRLKRRETGEARIRIGDLVRRRRAGGRAGFNLKNIDQIQTLPPIGDGLPFKVGFRKNKMQFEFDENNTIVWYHANIDVFFINVFHVPPDYIVDSDNPLKIGTADIWAQILSDESGSEQEWEFNTKANCLYTPKDADRLPPELLNSGSGPGALITMVVQALFGTQKGLKYLGLEQYDERTYRALERQFLQYIK